MANLLDLRTGESKGKRKSTRCIGPGGDYLAYGDDMELLHLNSEEPIVRLAAGNPGTCYLPQFSRDGRQIAWGNSRGRVFVCEIQMVLARLKKVGLSGPES
jgi:hypothetical protein